MLNMYKDIKDRGNRGKICRTGNIITEIKMSIDMFNRILNSAAKQKKFMN